MHRFFWTAMLFTAVTVALNAQIPSSKHVYIVAEENRSYEEIVGSSNMPYLNNLIAHGALATQFYANQHSSLPDYFWLTAGQAITSNNETAATYDVDNIVRHILQLGLTYKGYAESLPYPGYAGLYNAGTPYLKRHMPLPYFADMGNSQTEMQKLVPMTQFDADVQNGIEPNFGFITPDASNDLHDCAATLPSCEQRADNWLKTHIGPLLARPEFQPGGDGLLIFWTDEADLGTDNRCSATVMNGCGGRIVVVMYGPRVKQGYQSTVTYKHENVLRTVLMALGSTSSFPGAANNAAPMTDVFVSNGSTTISVQCPINNANVTSPMHVAATASGPRPIVALQVYVDHLLKQTVQSDKIATDIPLSVGPHLVVIQSWDNAGAYTKLPLNVNAVAAPSPAIAVQSPANNSTVATSMQVVASATGPNPIVAMQVYVDQILKTSAQSSGIDVTVPVTPGQHYLVIQSWDNLGHYFKQPLNITAVASPGITITSPMPAQTVSGPVHVVSIANSATAIVATRIYVDNQSVFNTSTANVDTSLQLRPGSHYLVVQNWDSNGKVTKAAETFTVR